MDYNFSYFFDIYDRQFKFTNNTKILNNGVNNINLISFFLASPEGNYHTEEIDFEALTNENIIIPKEYDFNHLIPPIELYKKIIDEYCAVMDPRKLAPLQNQIKEKDNIIFTLTQEKQNLLNEKNNLENKLNSIPIKKQRLELANLEQDLIIKKLESKKLAKSLG
ncbi:sugar transferase, partial [Campylobacter jejuni]